MRMLFQEVLFHATAQRRNEYKLMFKNVAS